MSDGRSRRLSLQEKFRLAIVYKRIARNEYVPQGSDAVFRLVAREFNDGTVPKRGRRFLAKQMRKILLDMARFAAIMRHLDASESYLDGYRLFRDMYGKDFKYWTIIREYQDDPRFDFY